MCVAAAQHAMTYCMKWHIVGKSISLKYCSSLNSSTKPSFNSKNVFGAAHRRNSVTSGRSSASSAKQHYMTKARYMPGKSASVGWSVFVHVKCCLFVRVFFLIQNWRLTLYFC